MSQELQVVTDFITEVRRFVLINSDHDPVMTRWAGTRLTIPGRTEVVPQDPKDPTKFVSAKDSQGYIPGTLVLSDRYSQDGQGGEGISFDAGFAVRYILGVSARNGVATSNFAKRGLSLLPRGSNRERLEEIRRSGHARSQTWRIEQARMLVQDIDQANAKRESKKLPPIPGGHDYVRAVFELQAYREQEKELVKRVLAPEPFFAGPVEELQPEELEKDRELADYLKLKVQELAPKEMPAETQQQLIEKLMLDPAAMTIFKKRFEAEYKMVKRLRPLPLPRKKPEPRAVAAIENDLEAAADIPPVFEPEPAPEDPNAPPTEPPMVGVGGDLPPAYQPVGDSGLPQHIIDKFNDPEPAPDEKPEVSNDLDSIT